MRVSSTLLLLWWSTQHCIANALLAATPKLSLRMVTQPNINHSGSLRRSNARNKWTSSIWDGHLDLAISAHQTKCWSVVRLLCRRVISRADDWSAVEQAYLRLALAEQKGEGVKTARRVFQEGTAACPSSDTLLMAWALMESKARDERSQKVSRALLRRAIALNPRRHASVLAWRMFVEWKEAGEATVEAVRSAVPATGGVSDGVNDNSNRQSTGSKSPAEMATLHAYTSEATTAKSRPTASTGTTAAATATTTTRGSHTDTVTKSRRQLQREKEQGQRLSWVGGLTDSIAAISAVPTRSKQSPPRTSNSSSSTSTPGDFITRWGQQWSEKKERLLADELLALCESRPNSLWQIQELVEKLEERGQNRIGAGMEGQRELAGGWRLAFTTCAVTNRAISRSGLEVCERLTPPIQEITPKPGEPPVPFRCEVLVRPDSCCKKATSTSNNEGNNKRDGLTHFLRGWAVVRARTCDKTGRRHVSLRQQLAPRTVTRSSALSDADNDQSTHPATTVNTAGRGSSATRGRRIDSMPNPGRLLPRAALSALGQVMRGRKGLETLVTQNVTYIGPQMRIGRSREGGLFVYERCDCAWPESKWL